MSHGGQSLASRSSDHRDVTEVGEQLKQKSHESAYVLEVVWLGGDRAYQVLDLLEPLCPREFFLRYEPLKVNFAYGDAML